MDLGVSAQFRKEVLNHVRMIFMNGRRKIMKIRGIIWRKGEANEGLL